MKPLLTVVFFLLFSFHAYSQSCDNWLFTPSQPSFVRVGDLDIPGNKVTVEAVFTRTTPWSGVDLFQGDLVSKHLDPKDVNYLLRPSSAEITTTNGYFKTPTICPIELNKTYHAAMVYDGTTLKFYRNGFLMSQIAATGNLIQNDWQTQIGLFDNQQTQENFIGYIKEVRIWNIARTQSEIKSYMNKSLPSPQTILGLLAYYNFDNLKNKQGNIKWDGSLGGSASIKQTNPNCNFVADSCNIIPTPPINVRASFTTPDTVCVNDPVTIKNTSTGATNYYWNFCVADVNVPPVGLNLGNIGNHFSQPVFIDMEEDNGNYYGFVVNHVPGGITRLDFGNSLLNTPTSVFLGNISGVMNTGYGSEGIQIIKSNGKWYGILAGGSPASGSTPKLITIYFGANLNNPNPTAINWGNLGDMLQPVDLHVFQEDGVWYGFTVNAENNTITRFNFTNSFDNAPTAANLGNIGNLNYPTGVCAIKDNTNWRVFVANAGNVSTSTGASITRLDFGNSLLNTPTGVNLGNPNNQLHFPRDITFINYCGHVSGFVVNGSSNDIVQLNLNSLTDNPTAVSLGNIGNLNFPHSISKLFRVGNDIYSFITNVNNNTITRLKFTGCTNSSIPNSTLQTPPQIIYNKPGIYNINLSVDDGLPTQTAFCRSIVVMPKLQHTPTKQLSICTGDSVLLSSANSIRNTWSTGSTANAIYARSSGTYWVQSTNGACSNIDTFIVTTGSAPFSVNLGKDTAICRGDSVVLDASNIGANYLWQNGQTTQKFIATVPGKYYVSVTNKGCTAQDTIVINQLPAPTFTISSDTTICQAGKANLNVTGGAKYLWYPSTGLSGSNIANPTASPIVNTTYKVAVTGESGCVAYDSVSVSIKPKPTFTIEPVANSICFGDTISLKASGGDLYAWSPAINLTSTTEAITKAFPAVTTTYAILVKDAYCNIEDSLYTTITVKEKPNIKASKSNDLDCSNGQAQLMVVGAENYEWSPIQFLSNSHIQSPVATPNQTTTFHVKGISDGCFAEDSVIVNVLHTGLSNFYLPNAFTPNGDGLNDCFGIKYWSGVTVFSMEIYNRWGERIFTTNKPGACWDGYYKGNVQPADIYVYYIKAKTLCGGVIKNGTIMLVR